MDKNRTAPAGTASGSRLETTDVLRDDVGVAHARAIARIDLGRRLRNRRLELRLTTTEVGAAIEKSSQSYGDVERGLKSFEDIRVWMRIAIALQLNRETLLEQAWETRDGFIVALPPIGDVRRTQLVRIAGEIAGADLPEQL